MLCKPAKTYDEQVEILVDKHGLDVEDKQLAIQALRKLNYYHLRGYYIHWMDKEQKLFRPDVSFNMITSLCDFDEKLQMLIWPLIQHIELNLRTHLAYYLAHKYDPLVYLDESAFQDPLLARESKDIILYKIEHSSEPFVKHHKKKYNGELPVWGVVELLSFSNLSKIFSNLKNIDKGCIASEYYGLDGELVDSYIHSILCVRNICAHCGRIYNKRLSTPVRISDKNMAIAHKYVGPTFVIYPNNFFAVLLALKDLSTPNEFVGFIESLKQLLSEYSLVVDTLRLGMPREWESVLRE